MLIAPALSRHGVRWIVCLGCLCLLTLSGCAVGQQTPTATPAPTSQALSGLPVGQLDPAPPPSGWQRLRSGVRFTDQTGDPGLVASEARPGRLAGCALATGAPNSPSVPTFVLSDDAGQTWQVRHIRGALPNTVCRVSADTMQPDTFAIESQGSGNGEPNQTFITTDAGQTWQTVDPGCSGPVFLTALVAGTIFAGICSSGQPAIAQVSGSRVSAWQHINLAPPGLSVDNTVVDGIAIDPDDPTRIYAAITEGRFDTRLYSSSDGGNSWHVAHEWATAQRVALWTAQGHQVFVQDLADMQVQSALFFYSPDGGTTWHGIGLHDRTGIGESIYVGPTGRVLTAYGATSGPNPTSRNLFSLDPTTGDFSLLTNLDSLPNQVLGVIVDGASPRFIYASQTDTYIMPLPSD